MTSNASKEDELKMVSQPAEADAETNRVVNEVVTYHMQALEALGFFISKLDIEMDYAMLPTIIQWHKNNLGNRKQ